jgi:phosphatidylethanolamine/phosphatidyl-N-methylethanolamine N-methyltransferase
VSSGDTRTVNISALQRLYPSGLGSFVRSWVENPLSVGAVAPSGRPLAKLMTRSIFRGARVVELGPGTGTLTQAILERGVAPTDLYCVEHSATFVPVLERRFPGVTVIHSDATQPNSYSERLHGSVDFVISGLPLVLFSGAQKSALLDQSFAMLRDDGALFQFTYGWRCPIGRKLLREHRLSVTRAGAVALNVPPAFVFRLARNGR